MSQSKEIFRRGLMLIVIGCNRALQWGQTILNGVDAVSSHYNFMLRVPGYFLAEDLCKRCLRINPFLSFPPWFFFYRVSCIQTKTHQSGETAGWKDCTLTGYAQQNWCLLLVLVAFSAALSKCYLCNSFLCSFSKHFPKKCFLWVVPWKET